MIESQDLFLDLLFLAIGRHALIAQVCKVCPIVQMALQGHIFLSKDEFVEVFNHLLSQKLKIIVVIDKFYF
jgi:hypothetical protein